MATIRKNFAYNSVLTILNVLFPILSFPYASRMLGPAAIGKSQFILALAQYFVVFSVLGIPIYGLREVAKVRHDKTALSDVFCNIVLINMAASLIMTVLYVIVIIAVPQFNTDIKGYLLCSILIFISFSNIDWFYSGLENFKQITIRSLSIKVISLIALFLFVKSRQDTIIYLAINVFSSVGNQLWNVLMLKNKITFSFSTINTIKHLKAIILNFGVLFAVSLYTALDTVLLGILGNETSVGYYSAAVKFNRVVIPLVTALSMVLLPSITIAIKEQNTERLQYLIQKSFWYISFLAVPVSVGIFIFAPELISIFAGNNFREAILPLRIMAPLSVIIGFANIMAMQVLIPADKEKKYLIAVVLGTFCSLLLNFCLVHYLFAVGAAIANTATELLVTVVSAYFVKKLFSLKLDWNLFVLNVMISFTFIAVAYMFRKLYSNPFTILSLAIPSCILLYISIKVFVLKDNLLYELVFNRFTKFR